MREWTAWEWIAYAMLLVGSVIIAADTGIKLSPEVLKMFPELLHSPWWGFTPLVLVLAATGILVARNFGLVGKKSVEKHPPQKLENQVNPETVRKRGFVIENGDGNLYKNINVSGVDDGVVLKSDKRSTFINVKVSGDKKSENNA